MKSERSQVQESNFLADKIEQKISQIRPYLPAMLGLIVVAVLGLLGYGIYSSQQETRAARAWTDFYFSDTQIQDLDAISKDFADTSAGVWARMTAGDRSMAQAMEKWNVDRSIADQRFQEAAEDYREVVEKSSDPFVKSRGFFGLAQALEGLGKRSEAVDAYRQITALTGLPPEFLAEVNRRMEWLDGKDGEAFYVWYNEKRTSAPASPTGVGGQDLPSMPNISFPQSGIPFQPSLPGGAGLNLGSGLSPEGTVTPPSGTAPTDTVPPSGEGATPPANTEPPASDKP